MLRLYEKSRLSEVRKITFLVSCRNYNQNFSLSFDQSAEDEKLREEMGRYEGTYKHCYYED